MEAVRKWARASKNQARSSSSDVDLEACRQIDTSSWPTAVEYSAQQPVTNELLRSLSNSGERLDIKVGKRRKARRWKVHKALFCHYSKYFETVFRHSGVGFRESVSSVFDLAEDNPIAFELFINWLYSNEKQARDFYFREATDTKSWKLYAAEAYILADKIIAVEFSRYALSRVIQNAHLLDVYDMETIYEDTLPNTPLRLFAARWVRWRCNLQPTLWESSRNREFQSDRRKREPNMDNQTVIDPRTFEIKHWYSECGRSGTACLHATVWTGSDPTTTARTKPDFPRTWSKRDRHDHPTKAKTLLTTFAVVFSSVLLKLGTVALLAGLLIMVVMVSIKYGHCGGCHGCAPSKCDGCRESCDHWCTHHAFLFCCQCNSCQCCGGFPFCCFVWCCCQNGYDGSGCDSCVW